MADPHGELTVTHEDLMAAPWACEAHLKLLWDLHELAHVAALTGSARAEPDGEGEWVSNSRHGLFVVRAPHVDGENIEELRAAEKRVSEVAHELAQVLIAAYVAAARGDAKTLAKASAWARNVLLDAPRSDRLKRQIASSRLPALAALERTAWSRPAAGDVPDALPTTVIDVARTISTVHRGNTGKRVRLAAADALLREIRAVLRELGGRMPEDADPGKIGLRLERTVAMYFQEAKHAFQPEMAGKLLGVLQEEVSRPTGVDEARLARKLLKAAGLDPKVANNLFKHRDERDARDKRGRKRKG
jgi:hypothetical protein